MNYYKKCVFFFIFSFCIILKSGYADTTFNAVQQQNIHQQQRQKALKSQLDTIGKDVHAEEEPKVSQSLTFIDTPSCLLIKQVLLEQDRDIARRLSVQHVANQAVGHCMSSHNIKVAVINLQNKLIASGYITSGVILPEQNVGEGQLRIKISSGKIGKLFLLKDADKYVHIANTFPTQQGKRLNLRDIEQGLENMQSIPGSEVHINLLPAAEPDTTDVAIERYQSSFWRLASWIDDSGSRASGRYQAGIAFYLDNPTSLNDLFYISATHDLHNNAAFGSRSTAVNYTAPYGYWSFNLYASKSQYHQQLSGDFSDFRYQGKDQVTSGKISRILHRGAQQKTTLSTQLIKRNAHYYVADVELELQKIDTTQLRLELAHRHYLRDAVIDSSLGFQRNVRWLGSQQTAEAQAGTASDISRIVTLDLQALVPFHIADLSLSWQPHYYQQYTADTLVSQDQISMGNRWSVRGFDGENTLTGDRGWYFSNTLNLDLSQTGNHQLYSGMDYGRVSQFNQSWGTGKAIAGAVIGIKGQQWHTGYDLFAGIPVIKPNDMLTDNLTLGMTLQWMY